jgi:hypothetical protein
VRVTVIATGFGDQRRRKERKGSTAEKPAEEATRGFDVPQDILEVPSFLRDE